MERKYLYDIVSNKILIKFDFIKNLGYELNQVDYTSAPYNMKNIVENLSITFVKTGLKREIEFYYIPFQSETNIAIHNFSILIWDKKNMRHIEIGYFMKLRHNDEYKQLSLSSFEGAYEERLDQLLDYIVNIMQKYLIEVLEGKKWIKVPMDWGGAK